MNANLICLFVLCFHFQHETINQMISIRRKQLKLFEELTMFEQRILCHQLPQSFHDINIDTDVQENVNKHKKNIQEFKRRMLNLELEKYEMKIQQYEHLYQEELIAFQAEISNTNSSHLCQLDVLMRSVQTYLNYHTDILIRQVRWKESLYHVKLLRHYHRQLLSARKNVIDVYPQVIVDVEKISLNRIQLDYLSRNGELRILFNRVILIKKFVIIK